MEREEGRTKLSSRACIVENSWHSAQAGQQQWIHQSCTGEPWIPSLSRTRPRSQQPSQDAPPNDMQTP
eukprot:COSAG04_NODE_731_length_10733_cov_3.264435_8_plen_68_part_00